MSRKRLSTLLLSNSNIKIKLITPNSSLDPRLLILCMDLSTSKASSFLPLFAKNFGDSWKKLMAMPPIPEGIARTTMSKRQGVKLIPSRGISSLKLRRRVGYVTTGNKKKFLSTLVCKSASFYT